MYDFDMDVDAETQKIDAKIKKLQEERAQLLENAEEKKLLQDLARKVGVIVVSEFQGKAFEYQALEKILEENLISDSERQFFNLQPLAEDDPKRPKKRGRKKREMVEENC